MAIPFVMPNEDADATLDQLIVELSDILMQIQILLRARAHNQMAERRSRVCCYACNSRRMRHAPQIDSNNRIPQIVSELSGLSSSSADNRVEMEPNLIPADAQSAIRIRHSSSESKRTKENISVATPSQDWIQVKGSKEETSCSQEGSILSKLVPPPIKGSIWTAVICVVGWHLLRTR